MNSQYFDALRRLSQPIRAAELPHTLEHVKRLLDALGNPQEHFTSIVVTGSTGKGTECVRRADLQNLSGRKVGLYISPHLHSFRERMVIMHPFVGKPLQREPPRLITQAEFVEHARAVFAAEETLGQRYSTFESATAIALLWFAQQGIDDAVLEVGIGGRFDAVNAVDNKFAIFTPIEAEHVAMLGGSLESVAWHKAGIIKPNSKAITVPQTPEVMAVLEREAAEKNAELQVTGEPLAGMGQGNMLSHYGSFLALTEGAEESKLRILPGRLETLTVGSHTVVIDGGHTPAAARHLYENFDLGVHPYRRDGDTSAPIRMIVGMLRDKNVAAYLSAFDAPHVRLVYTQAPGDRALTPAELLERFRPGHASVTLVPSLDEALAQVERAPEALIVVAGSLRMAAAAREALGLLTLDELEEARLTRAIFEGQEYQGKLKRSD